MPTPTWMAMDPFLVGVAVLCLAAPLLLRRLLRKRPSALPLPPGPRGLPIIGALHLVGHEPHAGLTRLARRYGPIMFLRMGTARVVVASTPAAARAFLKTVDAQFAYRPPDIKTVLEVTYNRQDMVAADYGPMWKRLRKLSSLHLLGGKALAEWAPVRRAEATHMLRAVRAKVARGDDVVLPEAPLVCAFANILGQIILSIRIFDEQGEESNAFKAMLLELLTGTGIFNIGDFVPAIAWMDLQGVQAQMHRVHTKFDAMVTKLLEKHAASAKEREGKPDFVDVMRANREGEDGETITDVNIKAMILDMFFAGTGSSIVIEWALAEMLVNPHILKRAQEELDQVVGRDRRLEESDIPNLPYLRAICKESMRLHPSSPLMLPHFSFEACEVEGYYVPANTRLLVNLYAIGRDPDTWEDPLEFKPERFLSGKGAKIEPFGRDFELIPFGAGRRVCIGLLAGMVFVQYMLGTLLHSFDWALPDGVTTVNLEEKFGLSLPMAVPLKAKVSPRLPPSAYE